MIEDINMLNWRILAYKKPDEPHILIYCYAPNNRWSDDSEGYFQRNTDTLLKKGYIINYDYTVKSDSPLKDISAIDWLAHLYVMVKYTTSTDSHRYGLNTVIDDALGEITHSRRKGYAQDIHIRYDTDSIEEIITLLDQISKCGIHQIHKQPTGLNS